MSRYIDADALTDKILEVRRQYERVKDSEKHMLVLDSVVSWLEGEPTAPAIDVVRCKDCIYYAKNIFGTMGCVSYTGMPSRVRGNDYCSRGIRK